MKLTVLTTACHRPEAWKLSELYMSRQTLQPVQWLVLDDDEQQTVCTMGQDYHYWPEFRGRGSLVKKIRRAMANKLVKGDAIVVWENDDWYASDYLAFCADGLSRNAIFGEGFALYNNVRLRWWSEHTNMKHAALCATSLTKALFPWLAKQANLSDEPHIDQRLWHRCPLPGKVVNPHMKGPRRVVGIKAMPGKAGYSWGHGDKDANAKDDLELVKLRSLIGDDADAYAPFYVPPVNAPKPPAKRYDPATVTSAPVKPKSIPPKMTLLNIAKSEAGRVHGPHWLTWLGHLRDKPDAVGLEIGTFEGDSAEWFKDNALTHADARLHCIDPFTGSVEHHIALAAGNMPTDISRLETTTREKLARFGDRIVIHKGYSQDILPTLPKKSFDFCYVDGSHSARDVLRDAVMAFELLKVGGLLFFDDYEWAVMPDPLDRPKIGIDAFYSAYSNHVGVVPPRGWQVAFWKMKE